MRGRGRTRAFLVISVLALVALGAGMRAAQAAAPRLAVESVDERFYAALARSLVLDHDYGGPSSGLRHPHFAAPGAPVLFAAGYRLTPAPEGRPTDIPAAYWLLAVAGTIVILATFLVGRALGSVAAGVVAAGVVAVYPPLVSTTGELLSEPLGALLVTAGVLVVVHAQQRERQRYVALGGVLLACAVLTRPDLLLVPFVIALLGSWVWRHHGRSPARSAILLLGAAIVVLIPWSVFASERAGNAIIVTESDATTLFIGTYLPADGTLYGLKEAFGEPTRRRVPRLAGRHNQELPGVAVLETVRARHPDVGARQAFLAEARSNLRRYALGEPLSFGKMLAGKVARMWLTPYRERSPLVRILHILIVALSVSGLLLGVLVARNRPLVLVAGVLASATLVHVLLVAHPRHNLPLMPLLIVGGCAGFALTFERRRQPQRNATNASSPVLEPRVGPT